jgi:hypothetical protein
MNTTMSKANSYRLTLSLALGMVFIYLVYFNVIYTPWNGAGGLYMPEFGLSLMTFLMVIPILVSLTIAIIFPRKGPVVTTLSILSVYVFLTWIISWPLIIALSLIYKVYSQIEKMKWLNKAKFGWKIMSLIMVLVFISIGLEVKATLTLTEQINRLGTDLNHQIISVFIILQGDWLVMGAVLLLYFRNKITLILMILLSFMYSFACEYFWMITILFIGLFIFVQIKDRSKKVS